MQHLPSDRSGLSTGFNQLELEDETEPRVDTDVADEEEDKEVEVDKTVLLETVLSLTGDRDVVLLSTGTLTTVLPTREAWALKSKSSPSSSSTTWSKTPK